MQIQTDHILSDLGGRMAQCRINLGVTQAELAERAGVGKRTIERFEAGGDVQLSTLIRLLGVLELGGNLDLLIPEVKSSPMELLQQQQKKKQRRRASPRRKSDQATQGRPAKAPSAWTWGDEQ